MSHFTDVLLLLKEMFEVILSGQMVKFVIVFCVYYSLSCMAVCDLLRGRNLDEVVDKMAELWGNIVQG